MQGEALRQPHSDGDLLDSWGLMGSGKLEMDLKEDRRAGDEALGQRRVAMLLHGEDYRRFFS